MLVANRTVADGRRHAFAAVSVILLLPVLLVFVALATDFGSRAVVRVALQDAVDAAVLSGVRDLHGSPSNTSLARTSAVVILTKNLAFTSAEGALDNASIEFGVMVNTNGIETFQLGGVEDAIRVTASLDKSYTFASLIGIESTSVGASATAALIDRPPVALWRLSDRVGSNAADDAGDHDGQYLGDLHIDVAGILPNDTSASLEGGFIKVPHSDDFLLDQGSVSLWFNRNGPDGDDANDMGLFSKDSSGYDTGGHLDIGIYSGVVRARIQSATNSYFVSSSAIPSGEWQHVVVSFGPRGFHMFLNGVEVASNAYTGGLGTSSGGNGNFEPITIGVSQVTSGNQTTTGWRDPFDGEIDEVGVFDRALTEPEAQWLNQEVRQGNLTNGAIVRDGRLRL